VAAVVSSLTDEVSLCGAASTLVLSNPGRRTQAAAVSYVELRMRAAAQNHRGRPTRTRNGRSPTGPDASLAPFTIAAATGELTAGSLVQLAPSEAISPLLVDPTGRFLYLPGPAPLIYGYAIDPVSGSLTAMPGSPFAVATAGVGSLSSDPGGRFLYISTAANAASPSVSVVIAAIDSATGALSSTNLAPTVINITELGFADPVTIDPSGHFAYIIAGNPVGLYGYTVNAATGALTPMSNPLAVGANPIWVAISR
jgi:6-phosphogluconolactonase